MEESVELPKCQKKMEKCYGIDEEEDRSDKMVYRVLKYKHRCKRFFSRG